MPSPKTILYISLLFAVLSPAASASPVSVSTITTQSQPTTLSTTEIAGKVFSWLSTFLYLSSRIPQLYKNQIRRSTAGLSPALFAAAFFGNLFYSSSLLTNPCAWADFAPGEGAGWVGLSGSVRKDWVLRALPFFLGAAGVLFMDAAVGLQFYFFSANEPESRGRARARDDEIIVTVDDHGVPTKRRLRWRRASGWMRGWAPSVSVAATPTGSRATTPADWSPSQSPSPSEAGRGSKSKSKSIPIRGQGDALEQARALLGTSAGRHASPRSYGAFGSPIVGSPR